MNIAHFAPWTCINQEEAVMSVEEVPTGIEAEEVIIAQIEVKATPEDLEVEIVDLCKEEREVALHLPSRNIIKF